MNNPEPFRFDLHLTSWLWAFEYLIIHSSFWRALSAWGCVCSQGLVAKPQAHSGLCRGLRDGRGWQPHCFHILPGWLWEILDGEWCWGIGGASYQGWECDSVRITVVIGKVKLKPDKTKEWIETAVTCSVTPFSCSQRGFHFIYLAGDGGRFSSFPGWPEGEKQSLLPPCYDFLPQQPFMF